MLPKQNQETILDLTTICVNKIEIQPNLLWKYQNTPISQPSIQNIDHQNSEISYTIKEYTIQGKLINKDCKNIRKIQIKYDQKSYFGLHLALLQMGLKEIAVFEINPNLRKTIIQLQTELENKDIPIIKVVEQKYSKIIDQNLIWIIEIHNVEEKFQVQNLTPEERLKHYNILKPQATQFFKDQQYEKAIDMYKKMRPFLDQIKKEYKEKMTEDMKLLFKQELSKTYSNQAICHLQLKDYAKTCENATQAIKEWDDNFKAYFIKAKAYYERGQDSEAIPMFQEIMLKFKDQDLSEVQKYVQKYQKQKIERNEQEWCKKIIQKLSEPDQDEIERNKKERQEKIDKNRQTQKIIELAKNGQTIDHEDIQKLQ